MRLSQACIQACARKVRKTSGSAAQQQNSHNSLHRAAGGPTTACGAAAASQSSADICNVHEVSGAFLPPTNHSFGDDSMVTMHCGEGPLICATLSLFGSVDRPTCLLCEQSLQFLACIVNKYVSRSYRQALHVRQVIVKLEKKAWAEELWVCDFRGIQGK